MRVCVCASVRVCASVCVCFRRSRERVREVFGLIVHRRYLKLKRFLIFSLKDYNFCTETNWCMAI